jgi:hypothetical protein
MFLLIANSVNPYFYLSIQMLSISFIVLLVLTYLKKGAGFRLNSHFWLYVLVLVSVQFAQSIIYNSFPIKTFLGEYLRIIFAALAIGILGDVFFDRFIRFVYVFAVISLCFYIPCILFKGLIPVLTSFAGHFRVPFASSMYTPYSKSVTLIVFNLNQIELYRNSGFYWEPGTHGGFLILALFLNLFYRKEKWNSRYNCIFYICILTTLSTTTYLALFFVIIIYLKNFVLQRPLLSMFTLLIIVSLSLVLYNKLDFLNNKINKQIEYSNKGVPGESRFNSFLADVQQLTDHPMIGTGRNIEMKFGKNFYNLDPRSIHRNNGLGVLLGTYGIPFFIFFFFLTWKTFYLILQSKTNAWTAILLLWIIGFSEDYFFKSFFIALAIYTGITPLYLNHNRMGWSRRMKLGKNTLVK